MASLKIIGHIKDRKERKDKNLIKVFIDFTSAYDKPPHNIMYTKQKRIGVPEDTINKMKMINNTQTTSFDGITKCKQKRGGKQGGINSGKEFNIFIHELTTIPLEKKYVDSINDITAHVDDLEYICKGVRQTKKLIKYIKEWTKQNGMELNLKPGKCGIMFLKKKENTNRIKEILGFQVCS